MSSTWHIAVEHQHRNLNTICLGSCIIPSQAHFFSISQWPNYRKISKGAHTIEVPKVRKQGTKSRGGGVWGLLRTIGDSRNVELGEKFGLEKYEGLRNNELRAPKARSPSRLGGAS